MQRPLLYEKVLFLARINHLSAGFELTLVLADLYINEFAKEPILSPTDLETKLDELTQLCEALLSKQQQLSSDNQRLTRNARSFLNAM